MEPQLPKPQFSPEMAPVSRPVMQGGEAFSVPRAAEVHGPLEQGRETRETMTGGPKGDPVGSQTAFTPPPLPVIDPTASAPAVHDTPAGSNPLSAADEDLIEKEWVEKAKKIVYENRNDPHAQDIAVGKLQADYLKKRYGKIIGLPKEE